MTFDEWMQGQPEGVAACDSWSFGRKVWEAATVKECLTVQASTAQPCPRCEYHISEHEAAYALMRMSMTDLQDKCDLLVIERDAQAVLIDEQQADVEKQGELANNFAAQVRQQNTTIAELQSKVAVLDGLSQDALNGGWTYRGMEAYAKGLEAKVAEMAAYNETRTDELAASIKQCAELRAKVAKLTAKEFDWAKANAKCTDDIKERAAEIKGLTKDREKWIATVWEIAKPLNCLPSGFSDANGHLVTAAKKQAALIEQCEAVMQAMVDRPKSHEAIRLAVQTLAAIAAHRSQS